MAPKRLTEEEKEERLVQIHRVMRAMAIEFAFRYTQRDHIGVRCNAGPGRGSGQYRFNYDRLFPPDRSSREIRGVYPNQAIATRELTAAALLDVAHSSFFNSIPDTISEDVLYSQLTPDDAIWAANVLESIGVKKGFGHYTLKYSLATTVHFEMTIECDSEEEAKQYATNNMRNGVNVQRIFPSPTDPNLKLDEIRKR